MDSVKEFVEEMKKIQTNLLDFLDHGDNIEEKFQNLINIFDEIKIHDEQFKIKPLLYLISKISNHHHREPEFFEKIEKIFHFFKDDIKKYFPNSELFRIFKSNKRLLLYLLEENVMIMDESIVKKIIQNKKYIEAKYPQYFQPEIQPFIHEEWFPKYENNEKEENKWIAEIKRELPNDFYEKRKIGENDDEICKLIQKDLIDEFITYVNKNCYPINSRINPSIYETNNYLLKEKYIINAVIVNQYMTLIEYAAFFGSIQIFNYLRQNGAKFDSLLWLYAVHGQNPEIISFLEENLILSSKSIEELEHTDYNNISYEHVFYESIKCHHIEVTNYIQENFLQNKKEYPNYTLINSFKYYNFMIMESNIENETSFFYLCKYDYYLPVSILLENIDIDINKKLVQIAIF